MLINVHVMSIITHKMRLDMSKYRYRINVKVRTFSWPEIVEADNLPDACNEIQRRLLADEPDLKHWETSLVSEKRLFDGVITRRRKGNF